MFGKEVDDQVFETAARLFEEVRAADGFESPELKSWLGENELHRRVYAEMVSNWQMFDHHAAEPEILLLREEGLTEARRAGARRWQDSRGPSRRALAAGIAAAFAVPVAASAWWLSRPKTLTYNTGNGEQRTVTLPDESRVFLDANTHLRVVYHSRSRDVAVLSGRANFSVAKDESRPFNVVVGQETVTAVGTEFTVELRELATSVLLIEGRVKVNQAAGAAGTQWMRPGDKLMTDAQGQRRLTAAVNVQSALAWQTGQLVFDNDTLRSAVSRMNDYASTKLRVADTATGNLRISGTYAAGRVEPFVDGLQAIYPIKVTTTNDGITIGSR